MCVCLWYVHVSVSGCGDQRRVSDLELELWVVVSLYTRLPIVRAVPTLNH